MTLRVLVAGAGAVGSVVGGLLACAGHGVTFLGRRAHLDAIAARGLAIEGLWGGHRVGNLVGAAAVEQLAGPYDAILLTVKSYDTAGMLAAVVPFLAVDGCVIALQNGLGNVEQVAAAVGADRALGGRVIFGAVVPAPGIARVTVFADPIALGAAVAGGAASEERARAWAARFAAAGIPTEHTDALQAHLWTKVFYNAALNPLGALLGRPYGALAADDDGRAIMDAIIDECFAVARARGVVPLVPDAAAYRALFYGRLVPSTADHRSSMLQDLERGRRTEIEAINGCIWRYGREAGIPTPVNATMTRLVRFRERT
ncbi:MAG: ketopantoate reductase family protein [Deltaproteobacteria bacterium]|nr:ketopantoate reductase family protein [Deltaproteobacteria bacterium]